MNTLRSRWYSLLAAVATALAPAGAPVRAATTTTVATGLLAPTKTLVTAERNLMVAEAGAGPNTGRISVIDLTTGSRQTVVDGLPSGFAAPNRDPSGPSGLFRQGRTVYVTIGTGDAVVNGAAPTSTVPNRRPSSPLLSSVLAIQFTMPPERGTRAITLTPADHATLKGGSPIVRDDGAGNAVTIELVADFADYVAEPRADEPDNVRASNPFGLAMLGNRLFVVDASLNSIRTIDLNSRAVGTLMTFSPVPNTRGMGPPVSEAVPDSIRVYGNQLLVTLLTGFPFPPGGAQVRLIDPGTGVSTPFIIGLTSAIDVVPLLGGGLLTLEHTADMLAGPTAPPSGRLQWFAAADAAPVVIGNTLSSPTALELDDHTGVVFIPEIFAGRILKVSPWSPGSATPASMSQFSSLSVRGNTGPGNDTLIAGFTIEGMPKQVLVRGVGPRLTAFGVVGALADPRIVLYDSAGRIVAENDNWSATREADTAELVAAATKAGAFPFVAGSRDAALLRALAPGAYTVHVSGVGGASGASLIEVYQTP